MLDNISNGRLDAGFGGPLFQRNSMSSTLASMKTGHSLRKALTSSLAFGPSAGKATARL